MRPPVNRNLNQRIRQALYQLKKDYGAPIDIYKLVSSETDARTGEKSHHEDCYACAQSSGRAGEDRSNR